jgi:glycosyltransferase involved in cell wall biosynthesis
MGTILYIGGFELPDKNAAAHRVLSNAKLLRELGYKVVFMDVDRSVIKTKSLEYKKLLGFDVWSGKYPDSIVTWLKYLTSINFVKNTISEYFDIKAIICYNYQALPLAKLIRFGKKNNIKIIADITEWYEDNRIIKKIDTEFRMKYLHKHVDGIICISTFLRDYYDSYVKTVVIPPLIDIEENKWKSKEKKECEDIMEFVYSGRPGKDKDKLNFIVIVMKNMSQKKFFKFNIIGITKLQYLEYYPEHIKLVDEMKNSLEFIGRISHEESIKYIKKADFQIFIRENKRMNNAGFPTKFVESMACGTPVLTTMTSDLEVYLINGINGFFINNEATLQIELTLKKVLEMSNDEIFQMKMNCKKLKSFDYRNFMGHINSFLDIVIHTND